VGMLDINRSTQNLLDEVNNQYVDLVGPIGRMLIDDAETLWVKKHWREPYALRNYVRFLAENIPADEDRQAFIKQSGQKVINATTSH
jgi:hypothetical protein